MIEIKDPEADYLCLNPNCLHRWKGKPGPTPCIKCGHDYVKWLNYEEMEKEWGKDLEAKLNYDRNQRP